MFKVKIRNCNIPEGIYDVVKVTNDGSILYNDKITFVIYDKNNKKFQYVSAENCELVE